MYMYMYMYIHTVMIHVRVHVHVDVYTYCDDTCTCTCTMYMYIQQTMCVDLQCIYIILRTYMYCIAGNINFVSGNFHEFRGITASSAKFV